MRSLVGKKESIRGWWMIVVAVGKIYEMDVILCSVEL